MNGWEDVMKEAERQEQKLRKRVRRRGGYIVLDGHYRIELTRIDSYKAMVDWVIHLSDKSWVTAEMLGRVCRIACSVNRIPIPRNA